MTRRRDSPPSYGRDPDTTAAFRSFDSSRRAMLDQWLEGSNLRYSVQCRTAFIGWFAPWYSSARL